ncbi:ion channel [Limimaricola cinnabarinus]|uniref:ion channel n=1 Tax=Limimaricola cinnabarinus TaxID=1125964 RepID=UPI002FE2234A
MIQAVVLSILAVTICTAIHYGTLKTVSDAIARGGGAKRGRHIALTVGAVTTAHVVEALIYTAIFLWAARGLGIGELNVPGLEAKDAGVMDYFYFSLVNFTTLGRGDLNPDGHLRFITGIEAFHGFLMITASGSFMLQVMGGKAPLSENG